jgi:guanylate kinase
MIDHLFGRHKAIIFTGPSGGGKTTLSVYCLQHFHLIERSISVTTRAPRKGEIHGKDYLFVDENQFNQWIEEDAFVEWEQVYEGLYYGTLKTEIDRIWSSGKTVLFVVDVIGANNLKKYFGNRSLMLFVRTPDMKTLEERLRKRGTEDEAGIRKRLKRALGELAYEQNADLVIINDQLEEAKEQVREAIVTFLQ